MPNWNPSSEVLGNEALFTRYQGNRVWAGAPARMQRLPSTVTETISALRLSATVDPLSRASIPTVIDIIPEGNEVTPLFQPRELIPNGDATINGWTTNTGATTNLFQAIDEDATRWPGPAQFTWIQNTIGYENYECSVNASAFGVGGELVSSRIGFVEVRAILGANTGSRKIRTTLAINGVEYQPAGGGLKDVQGYGSPFVFWWGELNPATEKPWTPADIANFGPGGTSKIRVRGATSSPTHFPKVYALRLWVYYVPENRVAVGVWRRPENMGIERFQTVQTDALVKVPAGTANWNKASGQRYLYYWRQSASPALYGAVVAPDVRWNGLYQDLGPAGQPPGIAYPLHSSGVAPPPTGVMAAHTIPHDQFGRPQVAFDGRSRAVYGLALVRSTDGAISADSQPYRMAQPSDDFNQSDMERVTSAQKVGQRVTPSSSQSYLGVRFPILPPPLDLDATLTVSVHRVSDGVQIGGSFQITADQARALPAGALPPETHSTRGGIRYVTGFLSSGASLSSGVAYEIRMTTDLASYGWVAFMPDSSLAPTASFGGSTNGAFIGTTHYTDRDLAITLTRQPDPPTGATAAITNVAVTTFSDQAITVPYVQVSWVQPAVGMGATFARYEIERSVAGGAWQRIANIITSSIIGFTDRTAPRNRASTYRIRAVGTDGRISAWATTGAATPTETRPMLILSSNHRSDLYFVHLYEITGQGDGETAYPILSTERDEVLALHGSDDQVVFMEAEDRGVGWRTRVSLSQATVAAKGLARFDALLDLVRSLEVPYVCAMDHQGNYMLGHVSPSEPTQSQPDYRYTAALSIIPTHSEPVPVEVT